MEEYESADDSLSVFASSHGIKDIFMGPTQSTSSTDPDTKSVNPMITYTHLTHSTGWLQL